MIQMASKLTDKRKKEIIADRVTGMSFRAVARKHGVSTTTVQRVVNGNPDVTRLVTQKKEQNTVDIIEQLDRRKGEVIQIIDLCLDALSDPEKYDRASVQTIATTLGILIDKWLLLARMMNTGGANNELLQSLYDLEVRQNGLCTDAK